MTRLLLVLGTVLLSASSALSRKMVSDSGIRPFKFELFAAGLHMVVSAAIVSSLDSTPQTWTRSSIGWAMLQATCSYFAAVCFSYAMRGKNDLGALVSFTSMTPLVTMLFSWLLLKEVVSLRTVFGALMMVCGSALIATR